MRELTEKLKPVHIEALKECARWADARKPYWWRRRSMETLLGCGLVEVARFGSNPRLNEYVPTDAGRAILAEASDGAKTDA